MADIVIAEFMDEPAVAWLTERFDTHYDPGLVDRPEALLAAVSGVSALIVRNRTQVRGALLDAASGLRVVGRLGVGLDNIDMDACAARGVPVIPATGANAVSVAEYVIAGLLSLRRGAYFSTSAVADGHWPRTALIGREVAGAVLGLIGFGQIARETAVRARALGMHVIAHDPLLPPTDAAWSAHAVAPTGLDELLAVSDAISLHVPLTEATRDLVDAAALARMKRGAVLINAARGGVVDESALAAALRDGQLAGAMLDVFETEPLAGGGPLVDVPNLILTPHIAGLTEEANARTSWMIAEKVAHVLDGVR